MRRCALRAAVPAVAIDAERLRLQVQTWLPTRRTGQVRRGGETLPARHQGQPDHRPQPHARRTGNTRAK